MMLHGDDVMLLCLGAFASGHDVAPPTRVSRALSSEPLGCNALRCESLDIKLSHERPLVVFLAGEHPTNEHPTSEQFPSVSPSSAPLMCASPTSVLVAGELPLSSALSRRLPTSMLLTSELPTNVLQTSASPTRTSGPPTSEVSLSCFAAFVSIDLLLSAVPSIGCAPASSSPTVEMLQGESLMNEPPPSEPLLTELSASESPWSCFVEAASSIRLML